MKKQRITKKYVLSLICSRNAADQYKELDDQIAVNQEMFVYYKNSAKLHPLKLQELQMHVLEDILDLLIHV